MRLPKRSPRRDATRSAINAQRHSRNDPTIGVRIGDEYAIDINESVNGVLYPDAQITHAGIQRLAEQLQPRFVVGTPPDVIENSGVGALDETALVAEGQLADLADLMAAPAYDTEDATFRNPGSRHAGIRHLRWDAIPAQLGVVGLRHLVQLDLHGGERVRVSPDLGRDAGPQ